MSPNSIIRPSLDERIESVSDRFQLVCSQLRILNRHIDGIQHRFITADRKQQKSFRYSIRIRLSVLEGIRNMHYEYALKLADTLDQLRTRAGFLIVGAHREHWDHNLE